ncbi:MAG: hypothetical protein Rpha_0942 [Candidatus Ruthia sp. Apha_13_S6]|nr:hypothetical protein [Candidatus Ruthia sp. Apha_13_S6]
MVFLLKVKLPTLKKDAGVSTPMLTPSIEPPLMLKQLP